MTVKPRSEQHARQLLNRTRIWANCHNLDRSTSSWHGKSSTISNDDFVARHLPEWYNASEYNIRNFDIHLACYNAELRELADFRARLFSDPTHPKGINKVRAVVLCVLQRLTMFAFLSQKNIDLQHLATETEERILDLQKWWQVKLEAETDQNGQQVQVSICRTDSHGI